ncbi:MAG: DUF6684 family protein [Haloferacaceae archaeon]
MANTVFDRETLLDLIVNGVPLFILLFFLVAFVLVPSFGTAGIEMIVQLLIVAASFVALAVLTYIAAVKITGSEKSGTSYLPGQANVPGSKPLDEREEALEAEYYEEEQSA